MAAVREKSDDDGTTAPPEGEQSAKASSAVPSQVETRAEQMKSTKPPSFYFAFLSLVMMVLVVSLDATTLPVALPVCDMRHLFIFFTLGPCMKREAHA